MTEKKPELNLKPPVGYGIKLPQPTRSEWKPPEILEQERIKRIQGLQKMLFETIRDNPIPANEACAALGGCAVWLIGLNVARQSQAIEVVGEMKRDMKLAIVKQWPTMMKLREQVEIKDGQIIVPTTD